MSKKIAYFVLLGLMIAEFTYLGISKTLGWGEISSRMAQINYGDWKLQMVGVFELLGAIGLIIPRTRLWALVCLLPFPVGGLAVHLAFGHGADRNIPAIATWLILLALIWLQIGIERSRIAKWFDLSNKG